MSSVHQKSRVDEDDDLDDLDDVLDQFSPQSGQASSRPTSSQQVADANKSMGTDFATELAKGMESLFEDLGIDPDAGSEGAEAVAQQKLLAAAWEAMLVEGMDGMSGPSTSTSTSHAGPPADAASPPIKEDNFQSRIRSTMSKLKESESGLKSSDLSANGDDDTFRSLLSQLGSLSNPSGEDENEEHLQGVLEAMMGQLMSKDVLYEPLKELHDKFPEYLTKNASTISPEDKKRFKAQISCIKQLIDEFEVKTYRDGDEKAREKIVALMGELQSHGQPPEEIMGPLPPGFNMGADGLPEFPEGCNLN